MSPSTIVLANATICTPFDTIPQGFTVIKHGKIIYLGTEKPSFLPDNTKIIDLSNCVITPGLIDLHVHGAKGIDFTSVPADNWEAALKYHTLHGTTSFLATIMSETHSRTLEILKQTFEVNPGTAQCLGFHLEGPYLNPQKRGVHQISKLRPPSLSEAREYLETGHLKMITIAPELDQNQELASDLANNGIIIAAGHSEASYNITRQAIQAGLTYSVHTGNALAALHQREPGILGALLEDERVLCEVIADGMHLHPTILNLIYRVKGPQGIILATDSSPLAGLPAGKYQWQNQEILVNQDKVTNLEGKLAGSCLTMTQAVKNMLQLTGCSLSEALQMASYNPAQVLGMNDKGKIAVGIDADLVVFERDLNVKMVIAGGNITCDE